MDSNKRKRDELVSTSEKDQIKNIKALEQAVHASQKNLNNIVTLLNIKSDSHHVNYTAIMSLYRIFSSLLALDLIKSSKEKYDIEALKVTTIELNVQDKQSILHDWLSKTYRLYIKQLLEYLQNPEVALQISALRALMNLLQKEGEFLQKRSTVYNFPNVLYYDIIETLLNSQEVSDRTIGTFAKSYVKQYSDLSYFMLKSIPKALSLTKKFDDTNFESKIAERCFVLLNSVPVMEEHDSVPESFWISLAKGFERKADLFSVGPHRKYFEEAWLSFMKLPLSDELYKQTLTMLHRSVMPGMVNPLTLMDFLSRAYDLGGPASLLALNGLFTLITKYNLTYPEFYTKLLADTFLASTHLPSYLVAAFIKRMTRLCLFGTPASVAAVLPFIYNLLKRHPSCMILIHRVEGDFDLSLDSAKEGTDTKESTTTDTIENGKIKNISASKACIMKRSEVDPFDFDEVDPAKCRAIDSSLWELHTMQNHYYTNISTLACMFNETFTKPEYVLEDFLDHTYSTLFTTETKRKIKKAPALAVEPPTLLLRNGEALSQILSFD
ncbi:hypothetical protein BB561_003582 [Smittium simulii]|uniref:CCAAT-binding factor domain-containing protein n=1 Tax=Smittium simulii TaxID=133385 RepID=A0A2T9YKK9_9FUNG|nr:hypothetical protein BB561_003582 [Smittium simulii]